MNRCRYHQREEHDTMIEPMLLRPNGRLDAGDGGSEPLIEGELLGA